MGAARERDNHGRALPVWQGCRVIGEGVVFLMTGTSRHHSAAVTSVRIPYRQSSAEPDLPAFSRRSDHAAPLCNPRAVAPIDRSRTRPRPGQVPIRRRAQWRIGAITRPALSRVPCPRKAASTAVCVFVVRTTLQVSAESMPVGLLTLMTACVLTVEPKSPRSGPGPEGDACADLGAVGRRTVVVRSAAGAPAEIFASMQDAIREARTARSEVGRMRVGVSGLSTDPRSLTAAMFAACPISPLRPDRLRSSASAAGRSRASRLIRSLARSRLIMFRGNGQIPCSQTPSGGPSQRATWPNFSMPQDAYFNPGDIRSDALTPDRDGALTAPVVSSNDRERGWPSALFSAKPPKADAASADVPSHDGSAEASRSPGPAGASATTPIHRATVCLCRDRLSGGLDGSFGHVFAGCRTFSHVWV
jgi:hypothetical protein